MKKDKHKSVGLYFDKFDKFMQERDYFGHDINLNFNKQGKTHNTCFGGIVSILLNMLFAFYVQK